MPEPSKVFQEPETHWAFLTAPSDAEFEGQHFDRKEACRANSAGSVPKQELKHLRQQVAECVSAFANANPSGGLVVVGISSNGAVKGLRHLTEEQRNQLASLNDLLVCHGASVKFVDCTNDSGQPDLVCLIYVPYARSCICETVGRFPRAWKRQGSQNIPLSDADRERLRRDKRIVDFERAPCCTADLNELDQGVLREFREVYLADALSDRSDEDLLYQAGAIVRDGDGWALTNAGALFFAANPQRSMPAAYIRLLRFDAPVSAREDRPLPTAEKEFTGPLTKQIRDFRTFLKESAFFRTYQRRNPEGGFIEEPEFPLIAVDEAIVNAVVHRDYAIGLPITCEKYTDALVVSSPGTILQPTALPRVFSLDDVSLEHQPRNPRLMDWLRRMRDPLGAAFVRALQEGTRQMRAEMRALDLPAPQYTVTDSSTTVTLYNNAAQRETAMEAGYGVSTGQFVNLFPIVSRSGNAQAAEPMGERRRDVLQALRNKLEANGWYTDRFKFGTLVAHRKGRSLPLPAGQRLVALFPAYSFQLREYWGRTYLVVDYELSVHSILSAVECLKYLAPSDLLGLPAVARVKEWERGRIVAANLEWCRVYLYDYDREERVPSDRVIPNLPRRHIQAVLTKAGVDLDLAKEIKRASLALERNAARIRAERVQATVDDLARYVFPLSVGDAELELVTQPVPLSVEGDGTGALQVRSIPEPTVEFSSQRQSSDIREGITRFGAYEHSPRDIEIVPICSPSMRERMAALIDRLRAGKFRYRGAERTFSTRLTYQTIVLAEPSELGAECRRLIAEHPEWIGNRDLDRIFLIHCPEEGFDLDDETGPYYECKALLFEAGIPCQMVDTPTLLNPDFKDLNLALNIVAKTGRTPWVLPESIPDADFFVGLSYTQSRHAPRERLLGFANVFNSYGRWEFYSASTEAFPYEDRAVHYEELVRRTLSRLSLPDAPSIYFHYSAKFSREDREAILRGARSVRPSGKYVFVWINLHHPIRLYDSRPETDGSLSRGSYVVGASNQVYLSTTGFNPYRKTLGTPQPLEINVRIEPPEGALSAPPDLRAIAAQILSLTKLNWASTDSLCAEPITTKYAGDVAYLTAAFLRRQPSFRVHRVLERTPWFI